MPSTEVPGVAKRKHSVGVRSQEARDAKTAPAVLYLFFRSQNSHRQNGDNKVIELTGVRG